MSRPTQSLSPSLPADSPLRPEEEILLLLLNPWNTAVENHTDPWQFALEIRYLYYYGARTTDLRRLVRQGYALHGQELHPGQDGPRRFQRLTSAALQPQSCLILTDAGVARARQLRSEHSDLARSVVEVTGAGSLLLTPRWDGIATLWWGALALKRLRRDAWAQRLIVTAFQEQDWIPEIDDPLTGDSEVDRQERLHTTIKHLNFRHLEPVFAFRVAPSGEAVCWHLL
jgi:hypothetical protein